MARKRDYAAEYARRQQGARERGVGSYYQERIRRAEQAHPGITRQQAAGHAGPAALIRALKVAKPDTLVSFLGLDRQSDGTWRRASFVLLAPDKPEREFILGPRQLGRLPEIADLIASRGVTTLGADYMQSMVEWVEEEETHVYGFTRRERWLRGFDSLGRSLATPDLSKAILIEGLGDAQDYYDRRLSHLRGKSRFMIEEA